MSQREAFLLRIDRKVLERIRRWADDDLRSVNAQIEFVLREALDRAGRWKEDQNPRPDDSPTHPPSPPTSGGAVP